MKVIIDIPENLYEAINNDKYGVHEGRVYDIIRNGTPLDDIKAEIKEWYWQVDKQALAKDPCVVDAMVDLFIRTIDKNHESAEYDGPDEHCRTCKFRFETPENDEICKNCFGREKYVCDEALVTDRREQEE